MAAQADTSPIQARPLPGFAIGSNEACAVNADEGPKVVKGKEAPLGILKALGQRMGCPVRESFCEKDLIGIASRQGGLINGTAGGALASAGGELARCKRGCLGQHYK